MALTELGLDINDIYTDIMAVFGNPGYNGKAQTGTLRSTVRRTDTKVLDQYSRDLTELAADGQMLNTIASTRNTISFEIGNEVDKEYVVKSGTDYTTGGAFIRLDENGVVDTPIPDKSVTVTKKWADDSD